MKNLRYFYLVGVMLIISITFITCSNEKKTQEPKKLDTKVSDKKISEPTINNKKIPKTETPELNIQESDASERCPGVNLFKNPNKLVPWSGPFSESISSTNRLHIMQIPLMEYYEEGIGEARIICCPKYGLKEWDIRRRKSNNEYELVRNIAIDKTIQKDFDIFAVFFNAANLEPMVGEEGMQPVLPTYACVYKKDERGWKFIEKIYVKDEGAVLDAYKKAIIHSIKW